MNFPPLKELEEKVRAFLPDPEYPDDSFIIIALQEAIVAGKEGNFAVGAVLVRENGESLKEGTTGCLTRTSAVTCMPRWT